MPSLPEWLCRRLCGCRQIEANVFWFDWYKEIELVQQQRESIKMPQTQTIHEINVRNWTVTGSNTPVPQYTFDLEVKWTDDNGVSHEHSATYTYPNDLASMPLAVRRRFAEEQIVAVVRVTLGINTWDDYG